MLVPSEAVEKTITVGVSKAKLPWWKMLLLGVVAGMFIALAGVGATIGAYFGGKIIGALIFPVGLFMVVAAGSELFTGNNLMTMALLDGKIGFLKLLKNWSLVFFGNLIGALIVAVIAVVSGVLDVAGEAVMATAATKVELGFGVAMRRGALCNFLVCVAVWMAFMTDNLAGKFVAVFMSVMLFVLCGFEHSVANMYYIPAGMVMSGLTGGVGVSVGEFVMGNLLPVTLGNIIGGALMIGGMYYLIYKNKK